jgi:hypothetical protein
MCTPKEEIAYGVVRNAMHHCHCFYGEYLYIESLSLNPETTDAPLDNYQGKVSKLNHCWNANNQLVAVLRGRDKWSLFRLWRRCRLVNVLTLSALVQVQVATRTMLVSRQGMPIEFACSTSRLCSIRVLVGLWDKHLQQFSWFCCSCCWCRNLSLKDWIYCLLELDSTLHNAAENRQRVPWTGSATPMRQCSYILDLVERDIML